MKHYFYAAVSLLLFAASATAQTADDIIAKYVTAQGGAAKLSTLKTIKMMGSMSVQGTDLSITLSRTQQVGTRMDLDIMGTTNYQVASPSKGSVFMPVMGMADPQPMTPVQLASAKLAMDIQGPLFNYKEKGSTVALQGTEKVDGSDAYHLELTTADGSKTQYFINAANSRLVKIIAKTEVNGQTMDMETTFSDFKQNADGYWFAYSITNAQGTITFNTIETNKPIDEKIYQP